MKMAAISRDRMARPVDISTLFQGAARRVNLIVDEPGLLWVGLSGNPSQVVGPGLGPARRGRVRGRGRGSPLPSWYPRTPLRDITAVVRAIERRRADLIGDQAAEAYEVDTNTPMPSTVQLEHEIGASTPIPTIPLKPQTSPANQLWKIVSSIHNDKGVDSDFVTPQRKLLNSIEKVREAWLEDQRKLERTPSAKKAEREKKIRTLMSMR